MRTKPMYRTWARIEAIARKEMLHVLRDWQTLIVVVAMPVVMMFLYGYALNMDVAELPVMVEDPSPTPTSRELARSLDASQLFRVTATAPVVPEPNAAFREKGIRALFRLESGFTKDLIGRVRPARLQVLIDGSDPNVGTLIRNAAEPLILQASLGLLDLEVPQVLNIQSRILYNPAQRSALFFVPGLMAVILLMISALLTSIAITREKENGTMGQLLISPLAPMEIIAGKILPYIMLAACDGLLILTVGRFAFGVTIAGSAWLLAISSLIYIFTALSIGLFISTVAKRQQHAMMMALGATMMPTVLLSGFIFPVDSMPWFLRMLSQIIPATYFLEVVRGIILKGVGFAELWPPLALLALEGAFLSGLSILKFKVKL